MEGGNAIGMKIRIGGKRPSTPEPYRHLGTSLPIRWHEDRSIPAAATLTLFGGFWLAVSLSGLYVMLSDVRRSQGYVFEASLMPLLKVAVILFGVGLGSIYWYFGPGLPPGEGEDWVVPVVGAMCAMMSALLAWLALFRVERLEVSHRGVRVGTVEPGFPLGDANADFMKTDEIEEVTLQRNKFRRHQVVIGGDRQTLRWGEWLSKREREMVRDAIIQTLAR